MVESEGPSDANSETQIMKSMELAKWKVGNIANKPSSSISFHFIWVPSFFLCGSAGVLSFTS